MPSSAPEWRPNVHEANLLRPQPELSLPQSEKVLNFQTRTIHHSPKAWSHENNLPAPWKAQPLESQNLWLASILKDVPVLPPASTPRRQAHISGAHTRAHSHAHAHTRTRTFPPPRILSQGGSGRGPPSRVQHAPCWLRGSWLSLYSPGVRPE